MANMAEELFLDEAVWQPPGQFRRPTHERERHPSHPAMGWLRPVRSWGKFRGDDDG